MYDLRAERELAIVARAFGSNPCIVLSIFLFFSSRLYLVLNKHLVSVR